MMVLVDTNVWIEHLRVDIPKLRRLLDEGSVLVHPFVIGELAAGNLHDRTVVLDMLSDLPTAPVCEHDDVLQLLHDRRLMGLGLGWIDLHLICAAMVIDASIWTLDRTLERVARSV